MTRVVKSYDERYTEFLDVAQGLFFSKGYEKTSVQEIIRAIGVAKGTFYHYFDSKGDILEAIVERMSKQVIEAMQPMLEDESLTAIQKTEHLFAQSNKWKLSHKDVVMNTARIMYQDANVLLREKIERSTIEYVAPIFAQVIQQGVEEGVFDVTYPKETAEFMYTLSQSFSRSFVMVLLNDKRNADDIAAVKRQVAVYNQSIERILGMTEGSMTLVNIEDVEAWL